MGQTGHSNPKSKPKGPARKPAPKNKKRSGHNAGLLVIALLLAAMFIIALLLGSGEAESTSGHSQNPSAAASPASSARAGSGAQGPFAPPAVGAYIEPEKPLLLNANHPITDEYEFQLADIGDGMQLDARAAKAFKDMQQAAAADGVTLYPVSAYRRNESQNNNYYNSVSKYISQGYSQEEAERMTRRFYAVPGSSEHEVGLAVDINSLEQSFENTAEYKWLQQNAATFGFITRYRAQWENITGIAFEPWHYRYVGSNHAAAIQQRNITLEEYTALLNDDPDVEKYYG